MNRRIHRPFAVLTLAFILALAASPAAHARPAESGRATVLAYLSHAVDLFWSLLTRAWGEAGSGLDPNGAPGDAGSGLDPDGSTAPGDEGSSLDPDGAKAAGDEGSSLDPNGGR